MTDTLRGFARTIGIDYSGAETAEASLKGLRVYQTLGDEEAQEVPPPAGPKQYWTRRGLAAWLVQELDNRVPTIVGIDHAFSFPMRYFERHRLAPDWVSFLNDFCAHWPTDEPHTYVDFVRNGQVGSGAARMGERTWRRLTEEATGSAKSVFHFDVQGSVAKSTHSGIPWLRALRRARPELHFWPFDEWTPTPGASVVVEAYPRLWSATYPRDARTPDQHDAYVIARWLQEADRSGDLSGAFAAPEPEPVAMTGQVEGWILGATWPPAKKSKSKQKQKPSMQGAAPARTTRPGFVNRNEQEVLRKTDLHGNDHNQLVYILRCQRCGECYGANGSDIFQRRCPACGAGRPGLPIDHA
ncbi:hypothetical protein [Limimaricola cinnabarinus]|uniref:Uncharacterized protein n=1 Tax=Limimaricola cinnabarinus LL-001 TaxID=1337093 RepID=U2Z3A5_9RHOB|nr:hypothetical protein [Limimaricola cinnabarinus]GAD55830.1 hypothetical protein MBELCI_1882 [Limimaricola cinnabarinus LL-001]